MVLDTLADLACPVKRGVEVIHSPTADVGLVFVPDGDQVRHVVYLRCGPSSMRQPHTRGITRTIGL
jgi:hypothetical protein